MLHTLTVWFSVGGEILKLEPPTVYCQLGKASPFSVQRSIKPFDPQFDQHKGDVKSKT